MGKFNSITAKLKTYLLNSFTEKDISKNGSSISAPCLLLKHSIDGQMLEITNFDAYTGKHYSGWYYMPLTFEAFVQRVSFNKSKLTTLLTKSL